MVSADDRCAVCNYTRENHGDMNHEFNLEPILIAKRKPEPARQDPPRERMSIGELEAKVKANMDSFAALLENLTEKGILDAKDILSILAPRG